MTEGGMKVGGLKDTVLGLGVYGLRVQSGRLV